MARALSPFLKTRDRVVVFGGRERGKFLFAQRESRLHFECLFLGFERLVAGADGFLFLLK